MIERRWRNQSILALATNVNVHRTWCMSRRDGVITKPMVRREVIVLLPKLWAQGDMNDRHRNDKKQLKEFCEQIKNFLRIDAEENENPHAWKEHRRRISRTNEKRATLSCYDWCKLWSIRQDTRRLSPSQCKQLNVKRLSVCLVTERWERRRRIGWMEGWMDG